MWEEVTVEEGWGWAVEGRGVSTLSRELERVWQDSPVVGQQVRRLLSMEISICICKKGRPRSGRTVCGVKAHGKQSMFLRDDRSGYAYFSVGAKREGGGSGVPEVVDAVRTVKDCSCFFVRYRGLVP